ncbi:hypothetical protein I6F11_11920 [Ensifer sp. NBAIM29]|nr:hypothetical protein [Ensifer sp. NBAIM29]
MTAILRATATAAFFMPLFFAIRRPQALSADHFSTRVNKVVAHVGPGSAVRAALC